MRWRSGRRSDNIEDRRGIRLSRGVKGGGIGMLLLVIVAMYFGIDPSILLQQGSEMGGGSSVQTLPVQSSAADNELAEFVSVVLADTEDTWRSLFKQMGGTYEEPNLVLFTGMVESACGYAQAAIGPFYCSRDKKVYIDLSFYRDLKSKMNAPGDFAQAYVIAHEVGHHVQELLGISDKVHAMRSRLSQKEYNNLSVRMELQADCFSGIWAHHAQKMRNILEPGDVEEALNAASMIGDDRLQKQSRGYVTPDSFTHGTSAQRVEWFNRGFKTGSINSCNTFKGQNL
ncbi:MAG: neutral zinc metallopeptidase [Desulfobacterales bacterium]